jgi:hypothetical protein
VVSKREMLENEFHTVGVFLEHPLEYRHEPGTVGSLEIVEDRNRHRSVLVALDRGT